MSQDNDDNDDEPKPIGEAVALAPVVSILTGSSTWTEEQWEAHEERIRAQREGQDKLERRAQHDARLERYASNGFPRRALSACEHIDAENPLVRRCARWDIAKHNVLVLSGDKGCGKTVAATWWALQQRIPPLFKRAAMLAAESRYDREERNAVHGAPGLVLDDLAVEYLDSKGSFLADLDVLFDVYYGDQRPLLITTNLTIDQFKKRYDSRIADRIRECGSWFASKGTSLRRGT